MVMIGGLRLALPPVPTVDLMRRHLRTGYQKRRDPDRTISSSIDRKGRTEVP